MCRPHAFTKPKPRPAEKGRRIPHRCSRCLVALAACSDALSPFQILKSPIKKLLGKDAAAPATSAPDPFLKDFSRPMSIPEEGIAAAVRSDCWALVHAVLRSLTGEELAGAARCGSS